MLIELQLIQLSRLLCAQVMQMAIAELKYLAGEPEYSHDMATGRELARLLRCNRHHRHTPELRAFRQNVRGNKGEPRMLSEIRGLELSAKFEPSYGESNLYHLIKFNFFIIYCCELLCQYSL